MEQLTPHEVAIIGTVATVIVYMLNLLAKQRAGVVLGRGALTVILYVVAFVLAGLFRPAVLTGALEPDSPFPLLIGAGSGDPAMFVGAAIPYSIAVIGWVASYLTTLIVTFGSIAGVSTLIYNTLGKKVMDGTVSQGQDVVNALIDRFTTPTNIH